MQVCKQINNVHSQVLALLAQRVFEEELCGVPDDKLMLAHKTICEFEGCRVHSGK